MKLKLTVKHDPADAPGSWSDSKLKLKLTGDRCLIQKVDKAIKQALKED